jgi:site-specific DNA recombinase
MAILKSPKKKNQAASGRKIAFYVRVSTEEQAQNPEGSIRNQEERLRETVKLKNSVSHFGEIVSVYIDRARSGKDTNRPELQKLLSDIEKEEVDLVMVTELSRLSRSIKDFAEIWELMQRHGCGFLSLREQFDTTNAAGELVLYIMANLAQFERKQVGERVMANMNSRASRGLYNGGPVPVGYLLIPEKKGYLDIEPKQAEIVKQTFHTFLEKRSLNETAKALNAMGIRMKQETQGGGRFGRLPNFHPMNLYTILKNRAYIGQKRYKDKGEIKYAKAVWKPIVDEGIFEQVQEILTKNRRRYKPPRENRYPFLLSGILVCGTCGERLSGKSAHGKCAKIPYYEHAWMTQKQSCLVKKILDCHPRRVLASRLEPAVWAAVVELLRRPEIGEKLLADARKAASEHGHGKDKERVKQRIYGYNSQLDSLTERLAQLPKDLPATAIFKQMKKIEELRAEGEKKLQLLELEQGEPDKPAEAETYQAFLDGIRGLTDAEGELVAEVKSRIIQTLIYKIEIVPGTFKLHFHVGSAYITRELANAGSLLFLCPKIGKPQRVRTDGGPESLIPFEKSVLKKFFEKKCSRTLKNGAPTTSNKYENSAGFYVSDFISFPVTPWYRDAEFLRRKYCEERLSAKQIGDLVGSARSTVVTYLKASKIPLRSQEEARKLHKAQSGYGERVLDGKLVPCKRELEVIAMVKNLREQGMTLQAITDFLNSMKIPTKTKKAKWETRTVWNLLYRKTRREDASASKTLSTGLRRRRKVDLS